MYCYSTKEKDILLSRDLPGKAGLPQYCLTRSWDDFFTMYIYRQERPDK